MRQMLDRVHAQVKQFSGLAAEPACKHDAHGGQFGRAILASLEKDAQARAGSPDPERKFFRSASCRNCPLCGKFTCVGESSAS